MHVGKIATLHTFIVILQLFTLKTISFSEQYREESHSEHGIKLQHLRDLLGRGGKPLSKSRKFLEPAIHCPQRFQKHIKLQS